MEFQERVLAEMVDCTTQTYAEGHAIYCFIRQFAGDMTRLDWMFDGGVQVKLEDLAFTFITFVANKACEGEFGDKVRVEVTNNGLESYFSAKNWAHIEDLIEHYAHVGRGIELENYVNLWNLSWSIALDDPGFAFSVERQRKSTS